MQQSAAAAAVELSRAAELSHAAELSFAALRVDAGLPFADEKQDDAERFAAGQQQVANPRPSSAS